MSSATDERLFSLLAPGSQVVGAGDEVVIRARSAALTMGLKISAVGTSELVRDQEATFYTSLDRVQPLTRHRLVPDITPNFRSSRFCTSNRCCARHRCRSVSLG